MLVLLGEVGGVEEYKVCEALCSGRINKPMVAWCIGTCGDMFSTDVQVNVGLKLKVAKPSRLFTIFVLAFSF